MLEIASATHIGLVRTQQQDRLIADPNVCAVADGMGGLERGEFASNAVISALAAMPVRKTTADTRGQVREAVKIAHAVVAATCHGSHASGSTVSGFCYRDATGGKAWLVFNVGDSRVYSFDGELRQVSTDHSLVQDMLDSGAITPEQAMVHEKRHIVTRCIGAGEMPEADFVTVRDRGQIMCAMTDGISDLVWDEELNDIFTTAARENASLAELADRLVAAALERGGRDNASVVLARRR